MSILAIGMILALVAAAANALGGVLITAREWGRQSLRYFLALGSGFMLGTSFLEMIPESLRLNSSAGVWVLAGYLLVHLFEHALASHFHFGEETHHAETSRAVSLSALLGMGVHTFLDGVAIGAGLSVSMDLGILVFLAVILHKVPDGFTIASIFLSAGHSRNKALLASALLGVSTVAGFLLAYGAGARSDYLLPLAAGSTLYVAATDLLPEVNRESGPTSALLVFTGVALFAVLDGLLQG